MPAAEVTLPGDTSSVPEARRFVTSVLTSWGQDDLAWSAALCVSELAANCALHAHTSFRVTVDRVGEGRVRIEVSDGSLRVPAVRDYGHEATTGRGLRLVDGLASGWGVDVGDRGKTVWLVLEPPAVGVVEDEEDTDLDALLAAFDDDGDTPEPRGALALVAA